MSAHGGNRLASTAAALVLAATLATAAAASASGKHLKLTAVVTGKKMEVVGGFKQPSTVTLYSVREGKNKVGTLIIDTGLISCGGFDSCSVDGTASLKVGKVRGKANLRTIVALTGCPPCAPPTPTKFKSNTGTISNAKHGSERISVNATWPKTKGSKVTFVLSY